MGGAVLAEANGVVGHHEDGARLGQRGHADGGAHVVGEDEEGGAVGDQAARVQADAVGDRAHAVLAHAEAHVALGVGVLLEVAVHLHEGHVGGRQVSRAADEAGHGGRDGVEHGLAVQAGGQALVLGGVGGQARLPAGGQRARDQLLELGGLLGVLAGVRLHGGVPLGLDLGAGLDLGVAHGGVHLIGHLKGAVLPLEVLAGGGGLISTQGGAVHVVAVGLVGGAVANEGGHLDEGGLVGDGLGGGDGLAEAIDVQVAVLNVLHVPAERLVAGAHILREGDVGVSVDRDLVVIVQRNQLAQAPVARQGGSLVGDALHVAAIAHDAVGVVIHNGVSVGLVVARRKVSLRGGQADGVANALAQGAGGDLHAGGHKVLGVARGLGAPLAELLQVLQADRVEAAQVQQGVLQHGAMAGRQHKAIAVEELGVLGVVLHLLAPQDVGHRGAAHGEAGVAGVGGVHAIDRQKADGVDAVVDGGGLLDGLRHVGLAGDGLNLGGADRRLLGLGGLLGVEARASEGAGAAGDAGHPGGGHGRRGSSHHGGSHREIVATDG
mmetsp:Transcript_20755/g.52312  ORF Transcript_20755/g.52312 Transcript_20755/m.52312 type:complete len:551 (-) Transcript_20755:7-1659(-)